MLSDVGDQYDPGAHYWTVAPLGTTVPLGIVTFSTMVTPEPIWTLLSMSLPEPINVPAPIVTFFLMQRIVGLEEATSSSLGRRLVEPMVISSVLTRGKLLHWYKASGSVVLPELKPDSDSPGDEEAVTTIDVEVREI
jgi:hypothetical protein